MQNAYPMEVIDLLREREAEFVRIWRCEQEIIGILGMPDFPFPPPPDLPSRQPPAKAKAAKGAARAERKTPAKLIRPLNPGAENAYRIEFRFDGKRRESFQNDTAFVNALLGLSVTDFQILSVETVLYRGPQEWKTVDSIWKADGAAGG